MRGCAAETRSGQVFPGFPPHPRSLAFALGFWEPFSKLLECPARRGVGFVFLGALGQAGMMLAGDFRSGGIGRPPEWLGGSSPRAVSHARVMEPSEDLTPRPGRAALAGRQSSAYRRTRRWGSRAVPGSAERGPWLLCICVSWTLPTSLFPWLI